MKKLSLVIALLLLSGCAVGVSDLPPEPDATNDAQPPSATDGIAHSERGSPPCTQGLVMKDGELQPTGVWYCPLPQEPLPDPPEGLQQPELPSTPFTQPK